MNLLMRDTYECKASRLLYKYRILKKEYKKMQDEEGL